MKTTSKMSIYGLVLTLVNPLAANSTEYEDQKELYDSLAYQDTSLETGPKHDYPSREVLNSLFKELKNQGIIHVGEGVLLNYDPHVEFIVNDEVLKNVYNWALDNEIISLEDVSRISNDIRENDFDYFNTNKSVSWACGVSLGTCLVGSGAAWVAMADCIAAAAEEGANPLADVACGSTGDAAILACIAEIGGGCFVATPDWGIVDTIRVGGSGGDAMNGKCGHRGRVNKVDVRYRDSRVVRIKGSCTDGSSFTVGSGTGGTAQSVSCPNYNLVSGLRVKHGDRIDAAGVLCDDLSTNGDKWDSVGNMMGGSGGHYTQLKCADGDGHLYGIESKQSWHYRSKKRFLNSIRLQCK